MMFSFEVKTKNILIFLGLLPLAIVTPSSGESDSPTQVSIVALIANPESYVGSKVAVRGYLKSRGGLIFLVGSKEAYLTSDTAAGIPVRPSGTARGEVPCIGGYVTLIGMFDRAWGDVAGMVRVERGRLWNLDEGLATDCAFP
jgi:hypothetical protein